LLFRANFEPPADLIAPITFRDNIKTDIISSVHGVRTTSGATYK
jgi:hypothetical protein